MRMSNVIVSPIASPAIDLKAPPGSAAVANTTQTRKKVRIASVSTAGPRSMALVDLGHAAVEVRLGGEDEPQRERGDRRPEQLREPVHRGQRKLHPPGDDEPEGDRRVEVPSGDVPDGGGHHRDHEPVRERDREQLASGEEARPDADEDEGEGADELGSSAAQPVAIGTVQGYEAGRTDFASLAT